MDLIVLVYNKDLNFMYGSLLKLWSQRMTAQGKTQQQVISNTIICMEKVLVLLCTASSKLALQSQLCWAICRMTHNYLRTTFRSKDKHNIQLGQANKRQLKPALILQSTPDVESFFPKNSH